MSSKDNTELNQDENEVVNQGETSSEATEDLSKPEMEEVNTKENEALAQETTETQEAVVSENPPEDVAQEVATPEPIVGEDSETPVLAEPPVEESEVPVAEAEMGEEASSRGVEEPVAETSEEEASPKGLEESEPVAEVKEEASPEGVDEPPVAEETEETSPKEAEETSTEETEAPVPEGVPEIAPDVAATAETMNQVEQILKEADDFGELVNNSNTNELTLILDFFTHSGEIGANISKAGQVKKAFDALKQKEEIPTQLQSRFSMALSRFNKKRSEYYKELEGEKVENSKAKRALLDRLKEIVDAEDMNRYNEVRDIQTEWKKIGYIRKEDMESFFREYRYLMDEFYKMREMYFQLRDYDRKINLAEKDKLLEELKGIIPAEEEQENREVWQQKNDLLTDIQARWKAVGHVPREDMDRINEAYRSITEQFFSIRHEFYETQDQARQENADLKVAFIEKLKPYLNFISEKPREWNEATNHLREMQEEWKKIGRAPQEVNSALWKEYRAIGNAFFTAKAEFFRKLDDNRNANLAQKRTLCEQAEALKDSTDWGKTSNELKRLQAEWKQIGPVPDRYSNKIWKRFRAACDAFFENRRAQYEVERADEVVNLEAKKALIEEVKKVSPEEAGSVDKAIAQIKDIQARWKAIGRVPIRDKDSIWKVFRGEIDKFFDDLRANRSQRNYTRVKKSVESLPQDKRTMTIKNKMGKIRRRLEAAREKIEAYSTNILYISKGKSGDSLRKQIQDSIDKEKRLQTDLEKEMKTLRDLLQNPKKEEAKKKEAPKKEAVEKEKGKVEDKAAESAKPEAKAEEATKEVAEKAPEPEAKVEETPAESEAKAEEPPAKPEVKAEELAKEPDSDEKPAEEEA